MTRPEAGASALMAGGLVAGGVAVVTSASFAALMFSGPLAAHVAQGMAWALVAAIAHLLVLARLCTLPGTLATSQSLPVAVLAAAMGAVTQAMSTPAPGASTGSLLPTAAATLVIGTASIGAVLVVLARLEAGRLARFLPYPVLIGVMASSGWLLAEGALQLLQEPSPVTGGRALSWAGGPMTWAAVSWAVLMAWANRRWPHPLVVVLMLGVGAAACHLGAAVMGLSAADLERMGWLLRLPPSVDLTPQPLLGAVWQGDVDWAALAVAAPLMAAAPLVSTIAMLLNAAALETSARQPVDMSREMRAAGMGNLVAALVGGLPGYHQLGLSSLNLRQGLHRRRIALWATLPCGAALLAGPALLGWLPRPVMGALLLFLALQMVQDALVGSWGRLSRLERVIVALVVTVTVTLGFLAGLLAGLLAAAVLFAVHCARIDPVRTAVAGTLVASRVNRGHAIDARVRERAAAVLVLQLQGFLFFGIADRLQQRVRQRLDDATLPPLRHLVLDCRRVVGSDSSAIHSFALLADVLARTGVTLVVAHASPRMRAQMEVAGLAPGARCVHVDDLDRAMQWCEDALLRADPVPQDASAAADALAGLEPLLERLPRLDLHAGERLIAQGSADADLFILARGSVSARRRQPDGTWVRLQTSAGAGVVVGEVGFYTAADRTADVVADEPSTVYRLTRAQLLELEREEPALALKVHWMVERELAGRVAHLVGVVQVLEA